MKIYRNINDISHANRAIAIGSFDGILLGHQEVIKSLVSLSAKNKLTSTVLSFEPLPKEFFLKNPPPRLSNFREKYLLLSELGVKEFICLRFNSCISIDHKTFFKEVLIKKLNLKYLSVGLDFKFGKDRLGDIKFLTSKSNEYNFEVAESTTTKYQKKKISSTEIRTFLQQNDLMQASNCLGRSYFMSGRVIKGNGVGRKLGYPTANIAIKRKQCALEGLYVVRVIISGLTYNGIASIGTRPTFGEFPVELEVYLLDFNETLYGKVLRVEFVKFLREQIAFDSADELINQMNKDEKVTRDYLRQSGL
jgi:riboflavin kinase/FMN adenylyltransferase